MSDKVMEKILETILGQKPSAEERKKFQRKHYEDFGPEVDGLNGLILIGVKETDGGTATEVAVRCACSTNDAFRAVAAILESLSIRDAKEKKLCMTISKIMLCLAGDGDPNDVDTDGVEEFSEPDPKKQRTH